MAFRLDHAPTQAFSQKLNLAIARKDVHTFRQLLFTVPKDIRAGAWTKGVTAQMLGSWAGRYSMEKVRVELLEAWLASRFAPEIGSPVLDQAMANHICSVLPALHAAGHALVWGNRSVLEAAGQLGAGVWPYPDLCCPSILLEASVEVYADRLFSSAKCRTSRAPGALLVSHIKRVQTLPHGERLISEVSRAYAAQFSVASEFIDRMRKDRECMDAIGYLMILGWIDVDSAGSRVPIDMEQRWGDFNTEALVLSQQSQLQQGTLNTTASRATRL